jgi:hypothetical protein
MGSHHTANGAAAAAQMCGKFARDYATETDTADGYRNLGAQQSVCGEAPEDIAWDPALRVPFRRPVANKKVDETTLIVEFF